MGLVCRSARGHLPRKRQRRRSLTVWKAETNRADYLGDEMKRHTEVCNAQQEDQEWKTGGGGEARSPYATTWLSSMDQLQDRCKFVPGR
ncbi:uncharacterized protein LOC118658850 isoform X2 [Myotis myotis]|uniref:uncharacterized protein LOC118658850 isoform X2 n=1 Tax=Myotis myotis TaxID=51298 RepID=UPI00174E3451|nr:uncharacterized protein LOC118658850 isoform X2 [Myotis myotis]